MCETGLLAALGGSAGSSEIPQTLLHALRTLDQELGELREKDALNGVVDSLVEWFLHDLRSPRSKDGESPFVLRFFSLFHSFLTW